MDVTRSQLLGHISDCLCAILSNVQCPPLSLAYLLFHDCSFGSLWKLLSVKINQTKQILFLIFIFGYAPIVGSDQCITPFSTVITFILRTSCCISRYTGSVSHSDESIARNDADLTLTCVTRRSKISDVRCVT